MKSTIEINPYVTDREIALAINHARAVRATDLVAQAIDLVSRGAENEDSIPHHLAIADSDQALSSIRKHRRAIERQLASQKEDDNDA